MFDDVYFVDDELRLIDDAEIIAVETELGIALPRGYHVFLTTLGHGTYCDQIYVFPPEVIEQKTAEFRKTLRDYFFWDRGTDILAKSQIEQSLLIARSVGGDELIYHPDSKYGVYVLPRDDDTIYWLSPEFDDPMEWHAAFGSPMPHPPFPYFEPSKGRACVELFTARTSIQMDDVASVMSAALSSGTETRSIKEENFQLHFHKAVGGRVQLTVAGDGRIGIRIDYNPKHEQSVADCVAKLESDGFFETGRHVA